MRPLSYLRLWRDGQDQPANVPDNPAGHGRPVPEAGALLLAVWISGMPHQPVNSCSVQGR